jgi:hypothetical protein
LLLLGCVLVHFGCHLLTLNHLLLKLELLVLLARLTFTLKLGQYLPVLMLGFGGVHSRISLVMVGARNPDQNAATARYFGLLKGVSPEIRAAWRREMNSNPRTTL